MSFQLACRGGCKVTLTAFFCLFSTVGFKCPRILPLSTWIYQMRPQIACLIGYITTLAAVIWPFPTMYCVQHVSSNGQSKSMQYCHNHRICQNFPHFVFWYESYNYLFEQIYNSTCCICLIFLQCASEFSNDLL